MKSPLFVALILSTSLFTFSATAQTGTKPVIQDQQVNIPQDKDVSNYDVTVTVPKGWSYSNHQEPGTTNYGGQVKGSGELLVTADKDRASSRTYVGFHDALPTARSIDTQYATHKNDQGTLVTKTWNGQTWKLLEYALMRPNEHTRIWYAVTHVDNNKELYIMAATPLDRESKYRATILKIMSSVKLVH